MNLMTLPSNFNEFFYKIHTLKRGSLDRTELNTACVVLYTVGLRPMKKEVLYNVFENCLVYNIIYL